jgi:hypothetical protein
MIYTCGHIIGRTLDGVDGVSADICDSCTLELVVARLEAKWTKLIETQEDEFVAKSDLASEVEDAVEEALKNNDLVTEDQLKDYVESDDLDSAIEAVIKDTDLLEKDALDDYVTKDEITSEVESQLQDADLVKEVVAGATDSAMRYMTQSYATKHEVANIALDTFKTALKNLSFRERLLVLFNI